MSEHYLHQYRRHLLAGDRKLTRQRRIVAETVTSLARPFGPEELRELIEQRVGEQQVSRSTVFRVLADLKEAGLLEELDGDPPRLVVRYRIGGSDS